MARATANSKLAAATEPPRKKRNFFSKPGMIHPVLALAQPTPYQRQVSSDRVLAALQPDKAVVVAAKTFVKEKMGDDKYDQPDTARVTRGVAAEVSGTRRHARPRAVPTARTTPKHYALGSETSTIGKRIRATTRAATSSMASTAGSITRKIKLRSTQVENALAEASTAPELPSSEVASASEPVSENSVEPATAPTSALPPSPTPPPAEPSPKPSPQPTPQLPEPVIDPALMDDPEPQPEVPEAGPSTLPAEEHTEPEPADKEYMEAGFYCTDPHPEAEKVLVNRILAERGEPLPVKRRGRPRKSDSPLAPLATVDGAISFPPLPTDFGYIQFFETEHEFALPYDIIKEGESGALDGRRRPPTYEKLDYNQYVERSKRLAEAEDVQEALCRCDPISGCGENCINRVMRYICGDGCPCGERCSNRSLSLRQEKATQNEARGFGLVAAEFIDEGEFIMEYRGEVIDVDTYVERTEDEYKGEHNYYALPYMPGEVLDAGMCGTDARYINHGCEPNVQIRYLATVGDGYEEYEIGVWATKNIKPGDELFYEYDFESLSKAGIGSGDRGTICHCGSSKCKGYLGGKPVVKRPTPVKLKRKLAEPLPAVGEDGTPIKRPRGRPRKYALPDANEPQIKRPRGRPRIHPLPDPNVPKRPRGRPRKHPLPDPNAGPKRRGRPPKIRPENQQQVQSQPQHDDLSNGLHIPPPAPAPEPVPVRRGPRRSYRDPSISSSDWTAASSESPYSTPEYEEKPDIDDLDVKPDILNTPEPPPTSRMTLSKAEQKAKRNGAPAGWVYVTEPVQGVQETASVRAARLAARRGE